MQHFGFDRPSFAFKTFGFGDSFSPLDLFAGGKQGVWYDPSDITTLFQDVAGIVPVTKDGDPVGLMLDKSQGLKLSPNILPNSDFSDGLTVWRVGFPDAVSATMVDGKCVLEHIGAIRGSAIGLEPTLNFEVGKTYKLIVDVEDTGASTLDMSIYVFQDATQVALKVIGRDTLMIMFTAKSSSMKIRFGFDYITPTTPLGSKLIIHSIKAQELSGNHATQSVSASRVVYKKDADKAWLYNDKIDDKLHVKLPAMTATVVKASDEGVSINYPVTITAEDYVITSTTALGHDYGHLIINKELSASEITQVTNYFNTKRGV